MTEELCIDGAWKDAWDAYTRGLELWGICLSSQSDTLLWEFNKHDGSISAKLVYECIVNSVLPPSGSRLHTFLWSGMMSKKIGCFIWLVFRNKILTWDNLQKRGWYGPGICALYYNDEESVLHIFPTAISGRMSCPTYVISSIFHLLHELLLLACSLNNGLLDSRGTLLTVLSPSTRCGPFGKLRTYLYLRGRKCMS